MTPINPPTPPLKTTMSHSTDDLEDPFDSILNLEEKYYKEGYAAGVADGQPAGLAEGRIFGLEKGFEKFLRMGRLYGRATVWAGRLPPLEVGLRARAVEDDNDDEGGDGDGDRGEKTQDSRIGHDDDASSSSALRLQDEKGESKGEKKPSSSSSSSLPTPPSLRSFAATTSSSSSSTKTIQFPSLPANPRLEKQIRTLYALVEISSLSTANTEEAVADFDDRLKRAEGRVKIIEGMIDEGGDDTRNKNMKKGRKKKKGEKGTGNGDGDGEKWEKGEIEWGGS